MLAHFLIVPIDRNCSRVLILAKLYPETEGIKVYYRVNKIWGALEAVVYLSFLKMALVGDKNKRGLIAKACIPSYPYSSFHFLTAPIVTS